MKTILVIGGSGVIGSKLVKYFLDNNDNVEFTYLTNRPYFGKGTSLNISEKDRVLELVEMLNPDVVIHTTAITNVDFCEKNHAMADLIHVDGTANIIEGCKNTKSKLVYVSTSFVFDGKKRLYFEDDPISPATYYGYTKAKGEEMVKKSNLSYLILRTDQPYCWTEKWQHTNSVLRVIQTLGENKILREVTDWYNNPTYVPDFVDATSKLIQEEMTGIFHLSGSDFISRYDWSLLVAEVFGLDKNLLVPITSDTLNLAAKRVNVNLSNEKIFQKTGIKMKDLRSGLEDMFKSRESI